MVTFDPELNRKVDIVEEQIDFSSARKQFLQGDSEKRSPDPQMYSAKPFARSRGSGGCDRGAPEAGDGHVTWSDEGLGGEFTCARAVMTMVREEEEEEEVGRKSPAHPEESDSGLDELSVRSQDTAPFSLDSAPFSLDSVSDSGASLPPTPQPLTPVDSRTNGGPTEEELEFHAGVLVQNALQNALAAEGGGADSGSLELSHPASPPPACSPASPPCSSSSSTFSSPDSSCPVPSSRRSEMGGAPQEAPPSSPPSLPTSPPQQQQRPRNAGPRIKIQSSYARALASSAPAAPPAAPAAVASVPRPTPVYRPPSPPSPDKPEFSYFSKYSEAAELRSTAASASRVPEAEPASGPFRLRSKKQRTLSMIEEEIRAAQQREEELKKQRKTQPPQVVVRGCGHAPERAGLRPPTTITPADKMKSNSLPAKLTLTARTAPGQHTAPISSRYRGLVWE